MALSKEYVETQEHILGKEARKALAAIDDYDLKVRTMLYSNLRSCGSINGKYDASVIAQTIANILEARAWEDYVEVDGSRKSCESFPKWLEICGIDIQLAEYCLKEKKMEYLKHFYTACYGELLSEEEFSNGVAGGLARKSTLNRGPDGKILPSVSTPGGYNRKTASTNTYYVLRLQREAENGCSKATELLEQVESKAVTLTKAAELMGWRPSPLHTRCTGVIRALCPEVSDVFDTVSPENLIKIAFHHALQTLTPELLETYKEELL